MTFSLTQEESNKIHQWLKTEIYPAILKEQLENPEVARWIITDEDGNQHPYMGAIGGGLTYEFTPTSLGTVTKVHHPTVNGEVKTLDVTDYDSW